MDFVADQLADGRRFRSLTVVDIYTRECLMIESEQRLKGADVVRGLYRIKVSRGVPKMVHCDNGSEFSSQAMDLWAYQNKVRIAFSRPGKPTDNAFVESFNGTFRAEGLNAHWFTSWRRPSRSWRLGVWNTMRVVLTALSGRRRPTNSPRKWRLAPISLGDKQPKTHPRLGMKKPVQSSRAGQTHCPA